MGCGASTKVRAEASAVPQAIEVLPTPASQPFPPQGPQTPQQDEPTAGADATSEKPRQEDEDDAVKSDRVEEASAVQLEAVAVAGEHWQSAQPGAEDAKAAEWQRPATWPARKEVPTPSDDTPHVVLSTKFEEPWYTVSRGLKEILQERGCTVYNPNTDNKEIYGAAADARWLLTFNENLEKVKSSRGFVLQIQQGVVRERSPMQLAEEKQSGWLQVPRIGCYAFASKVDRGGSTKAEQYMDDAITAAKVQWQKGVWQEVQVVSEMFEAVEGQLQLDEDGHVEGLARCTWPDGTTYEGSFHKGKQHGHGVSKYATGNCYVGQHREGLKYGRGTFQWADGNSYVGQYREGLKHGRGTFKWADGAVAVSTFEAGQLKGLGVRLEKASGRYVLLKDGEEEREIDRAEAETIIKEHGLAELPS